MAITTSSTISAPVNNVFQQTLLRNAKANCPYFAGSTPADISENQGTFTAKWRRIENLTPVSTALAELTGAVTFPTRQEVQPSISDISATVSKYGNFIFLNEEVDLVNFTGQDDKLMEILGICSPDTEEDLRVMTGFNSVETYAGQIETYDGEIGHGGGVRFISTPESSIDVTTGVAATGSATTSGRSTATRFDVYNTPIYGQDAVGSVGFGFEHIKETYDAGDKLPGVQVISKARGSAGAADPLSELGSIGWKSWHAGVVLNSAWGRTLRHAASLVKANE